MSDTQTTRPKTKRQLVGPKRDLAIILLNRYLRILVSNPNPRDQVVEYLPNESDAKTATEVGIDTHILSALRKRSFGDFPERPKVTRTKKVLDQANGRIDNLSDHYETLSNNFAKMVEDHNKMSKDMDKLAVTMLTISRHITEIKDGIVDVYNGKKPKFVKGRP